MLEVPWEIFGIFPHSIILVENERSGSVLKTFRLSAGESFRQREKSLPLPSDEITHGSDGKINHVVHVTSMDGVNKLSPVVQISPMGVERREI